MTSKQRAYLRGLANQIDVIFQIGKQGINDNLIKQVEDALRAREIIKIKLLENSDEDISEVARKISEVTKSEVVQIMGRKITLFKQRNKDSKIKLPE